MQPKDTQTDDDSDDFEQNDSLTDAIEKAKDTDTNADEHSSSHSKSKKSKKHKNADYYNFDEAGTSSLEDDDEYDSAFDAGYDFDNDEFAVAKPQKSTSTSWESEFDNSEFSSGPFSFVQVSDETDILKGQQRKQ